MFPRLRQLSACAAFTLALFVAGCGQPVREDHSINWSKEGQQVGFQHGADGVFVAANDGSALTKIFEPGKDVLAVSSPLWSPTSRRAIFTTVRDANGGRPVRFPFGSQDDPAGVVRTQRAVVYTCWMY